MSDTTAPAARVGTLGMVVVSLFILGCLGLQIVAAVNRRVGPIERAPFLWPFIDYPMYSMPHVEGDEVERLFVVGVLPDSSEIRIWPADLGLTFFLYLRGPVDALQRGNRQKASLYRDLYAQRTGTPLIALKLASEPVRVTRDGYAILPERVRATMSFEEEGTRP